MSALYSHHIPITNIQRLLLGVSSAIVALNNPYRDDMVAVCGETTACRALEGMRKKMLADKTGKRILEEKPRLSTSVVDNITPDSRRPVKFVDDIELAYVLQRYREIHDFNHLLLNQPTNLRGEVVVKWYEALQTNLPMCWLAAVGGTMKLSSKRRRKLIMDDLSPGVLDVARRSKFFMNIYFEDWFTEDIDDLRNEMKINLRNL